MSIDDSNNSNKESKSIGDYIDVDCYTDNTPEIRKYLEDNFIGGINLRFWNGGEYISVYGSESVPVIWDGDFYVGDMLYIPPEKFKKLIGMGDNTNTNSIKGDVQPNPKQLHPDFGLVEVIYDIPDSEGYILCKDSNGEYVFGKKEELDSNLAKVSNKLKEVLPDDLPSTFDSRSVRYELEEFILDLLKEEE